MARAFPIARARSNDRRPVAILFSELVAAAVTRVIYPPSFAPHIIHFGVCIGIWRYTLAGIDECEP